MEALRKTCKINAIIKHAQFSFESSLQGKQTACQLLQILSENMLFFLKF